MDRYAMNRCSRQSYGQMPMTAKKQCAPTDDCQMNTSIYAGLQKMPLAMAYVPSQTFKTTFEPCKALQAGTVFPELYKPFCGERRCCR